MALRQLMISREIEETKKNLDNLRTESEKILARRTAWEERERRAEEAFGEMNETTTDEERAAFDAEAEEIEQERVNLENDENENSEAIRSAEEKIESLQNELSELNERTKKAEKEQKKEKNVGGIEMNTNSRHERIRAICTNDEVRGFLKEFREMKTRGVKNADYTIPQLMLPLVREATEKSSKLMKHVNHQYLGGEGTQNILTTVPEAIWTETIGKLNEIDFGFDRIRMGGSKLGAYVAVPNPYLEDSDESLAANVIDFLGQANGYGLDKAIIYGTGSNMPVGIMTRLAASAQPTWWQNLMPTFKALNETHIGKASANGLEGVKLFKEIMAVLGKAKAKNTAQSGNKFWAMREETYYALQASLLSFNAAGALVTGAAQTMPIIGGAVEFLEFIPENAIIGGHGSQYLLVERAGVKIGQSEHAQFIEDNTVYKATSRWDGIPTAGEGFAAFSLSTNPVAGSIQFAEDKANKTEEQ